MQGQELNLMILVGPTPIILQFYDHFTGKRKPLDLEGPALIDVTAAWNKRAAPEGFRRV